MIDGNRLPETARDALIYIATQLSHRFTGEIRIRADGGNVRAIHFEKRLTASDFAPGGQNPEEVLPLRHPDP